MFGIERIVPRLSYSLEYELFLSLIQIALFTFLFRLRAGKMPKARKEFEENMELRLQSINHLRVWLSKQPHLPRITDRELLLFLHACEYEPESTKNRIDNYFTIRTTAPEVFSGRSPRSPEIRAVFETIAMGRLAKKTVDGYDVFISKLRGRDPDSCDAADIFKAYTMHADLYWRERTSPGVLYLIDIRGLTMVHTLTSVNLNILRHLLNYLQDALPVRLQGIHLLNCPPLIDMIANMVKPFLKPELFNLVHYHQANSEKLYGYVSRSILPEDYGGDAENMESLAAETFKLFLDNEQWFAEEECRRVDESKRQEKVRLNTEGPFRKRYFKPMDFD